MNFGFSFSRAIRSTTLLKRNIHKVHGIPKSLLSYSKYSTLRSTSILQSHLLKSSFSTSALSTKLIIEADKKESNKNPNVDVAESTAGNLVGSNNVNPKKSGNIVFEIFKDLRRELVYKTVNIINIVKIASISVGGSTYIYLLMNDPSNMNQNLILSISAGIFAGMSVYDGKIFFLLIQCGVIMYIVTRGLDVLIKYLDQNIKKITE
jgi:hypothetical protein